MGRAPCCDKANVKRGPWSPEEDSKLKAYIEQYGTGGNWIALPQNIGLKRCGKSCRLRWLNYLRPNIKHGGFSDEEDNIICSLYLNIGSRWSIIAAQLPGRTDNDIKNYWNTRLKKKLLGKQRKEQQHARRASFVKQEMNIESSYDHKNGFTSQNEAMAVGQFTPYWPVMPNLDMPTTTYPHGEPSFEEQESIKRMLIKLEGKFSDPDDYQKFYSHLLNNNNIATNLSFPTDHNTTTWTQELQSYESPINNLVASSTSTSTSTNSMNENYATQFENRYNNFSGSCSPINLYDVGLSELDELLCYDNNTNRSNANTLENCGIEMINNIGTTNHGSMFVNYQGFQDFGELQNPICDDQTRFYVGCQ